MTNTNDSVSEAPLTRHTFDAREPAWPHWQVIPSTSPPQASGLAEYGRLGDRLNELIALDLAAQQKYGCGVIEAAISTGLITQDELDAAYHLDASETADLPELDDSNLDTDP